MNQPKKKFNYVKWGFILAFVGSISTVLTVPEFRCSVGLLSDTCSKQQKEIELIIQSETGESLPDVKVKVIASGPPETQYTDSNGYVNVNVANKGDVRVDLSKSGYPSQNFVINLANDQNTVRVIRFASSGQPQVNSFPSISAADLANQSEPTPSEEISWNETARSLAGKVDQDFTYACPQGGTIGNVWGTDFYAASSSICSAAVHAGIINARDGGEIKIRIRSGEGFYNGTTSNGVVSDRYGPTEDSFAFLNSAGSLIVEKQIQLLEWDDTASNLRGKLDQDYTYMCEKNGTVENVWGSDVYTIGSSICSAAVHAGVIDARDGGEVKIRIRPGEKFYNGTTRNGIVSKRYDSYDWSFMFTNE
jgi:hypothetical protein